MKIPESDHIQTGICHILSPLHMLHPTAVRQTEKKMKTAAIKAKWKIKNLQKFHILTTSYFFCGHEDIRNTI